MHDQADRLRQLVREGGAGSHSLSAAAEAEGDPRRKKAGERIADYPQPGDRPAPAPDV